jgi:hypothetical protein
MSSSESSDVFQQEAMELSASFDVDALPLSKGVNRQTREYMGKKRLQGCPMQSGHIITFCMNPEVFRRSPFGGIFFFLVFKKQWN